MSTELARCDSFSDSSPSLCAVGQRVRGPGHPVVVGGREEELRVVARVQEPDHARHRVLDEVPVTSATELFENKLTYRTAHVSENNYRIRDRPELVPNRRWAPMQLQTNISYVFH